MEEEIWVDTSPTSESLSINQAMTEVVAQQPDTNWMDGYEWVCRTLVEKPSKNLQ